MAPTLPDEQRIGHSLGVFISTLHQDLQLEIAKEAVAKKMNINQARVYARQMAEEAGVQAGTAKRRGPADDYKLLDSFVRRTQEGVDALLNSTVQDQLEERNPKDVAIKATELEQLSARINQLRAALIGKPSRT